MSSVSHVSVSPGPSQPFGFLPVKSWRSLSDSRTAARWSGRRCIAPCLTPCPMNSQPASDRKSTRLNSSHSQISYAVFCLKKKKKYRLCNAAYYFLQYLTAQHTFGHDPITQYCLLLI